MDTAASSPKSSLLDGGGAGAALGAIQNQTMWARLVAVVEEQATALLRTAMSTIVREGGDLSCGIFDLQGRMMAQAVTGTPGHGKHSSSTGHAHRLAVPSLSLSLTHTHSTSPLLLLTRSDAAVLTTVRTFIYFVHCGVLCRVQSTRWPRVCSISWTTSRSRP